MAALVIVGANGMLGTDLVVAARQRGHDPQGIDLPEVDITDPASCEAALPEGARVVNCAAYTRVDDAETEREAAFTVNGEGAGNLARACAAKGSSLLQISTDYVFPGIRREGAGEDDDPAPINAYGASKLEGERQVRASGCRHLIVRAQSLFGRHGPNFVKAIAGALAKDDPRLTVVDDQYSSPTYTRHLAEALLELVEAGCEGDVHVRASGVCSWFEFAQAIADRLRPGAVVEPVPTSAYPRPAKRPAYSVMRCDRFESWTGRSMPTWIDGLDAYLAEENVA